MRAALPDPRLVRRARAAAAILAGIAAAGALAATGCGPRDAPESAPPPRAASGPGTTPEITPVPSPLDGQGSVSLDPSGPVDRASWGTWRVRWTAGPDGLDPGGAVVLQVSPFWGWSPPQVRAPGRPGWTTASTPSGATLRLEESEVPMTVVAHVETGRIEAGGSVTFVYGDDSSGPDGRARADRYAEARERFVVKTDGNGDGFFVAVPDPPTFAIRPGPAAGLAVAAPALAAPGDTVSVAVHGLDAVGNRTPLPGGTLALVLRPLGDETADDGRTARPAAAPRRVDEGADGTRFAVGPLPAGLWRLEARLASAPPEGNDHDPGGGPDLAGAGDLLLVEEDSPFRAILWGDIHAHSSLSDGTGIPADLYAYARDVAGLDVACVTDHDAHGLAPLAAGGWDEVRAATRAANDPGRFVALLGYEWTSWRWGHRNVYFPDDDGDVFAWNEPGSDTPEELWERIAPFDAMTIPHHPGGGPIAIDWSVAPDPARETVVEICSIHGSSEAAGVPRQIYSPVSGAFVRDALARGYRLGILASGDTHDGHPGRRPPGAPANGLAAFRTAERTRAAVLAALRTRRVYGTSGPRVLLASDWGGERPGAELSRAPDGPVRVRVAAPDPVESIELVGPDGVLARAWGGGRLVERSFPGPDPAAPPAWLYVRVGLAGGDAAWDSPWWTEAS